MNKQAIERFQNDEAEAIDDLRSKLREKKITLAEVGRQLDMTGSAISYKLNGINNLNVWQLLFILAMTGENKIETNNLKIELK